MCTRKLCVKFIYVNLETITTGITLSYEDRFAAQEQSTWFIKLSAEPA